MKTVKVIVIGGTGFIGPHVVRRLSEMGHSVAVFHRGKTNIDLPAEHILGDRSALVAMRPKADVVVDLILSSGAQAHTVMDTFRGIARRVVVASSCDVYRACGVLHGSEEGPLQSVPLTEDSELRTKLQTYPRERMEMIRKMVPWVDDSYDKIPVERAIMGDSGLPGTVLRLPMIYGAGDYVRRFHPVVKRIDDGRRTIIYQEAWAAWKAPRGYVENVAGAVAMAAIDDRAAGRIYNVAESPAFSELEWARKIADATGWDGDFAVLKRDQVPAHLVSPGNSAQDWEIDSSRIRRELGYREHVSIEEGIRRAIEWERANPIGTGDFNSHKFDYAAEDAALEVATE
ncbi:MAG: NAD-dependent epimerase/dehydratase family protein [Terracidiphilus sp.]